MRMSLNLFAGYIAAVSVSMFFLFNTVPANAGSPEQLIYIAQNVQPAPKDTTGTPKQEMPLSPAKPMVATEKPVTGGLKIGSPKVPEDSLATSSSAVKPVTPSVLNVPDSNPESSSPNSRPGYKPRTASSDSSSANQSAQGQLPGQGTVSSTVGALPSAQGAITTAPPAQNLVPPSGQTPAAQAKNPAPQQAPQTKPQQPARKLSIMEEKSIFNVPTANLRTMKVIIDEEFNLVGMVYGEELGYLHILNADASGNFKEVWKSPPLNSPVRGVFVEDLQGNGENDIVAYTSTGNIFIYDYDKRTLKYRTSEGTYTSINAMVVMNIDSTPEKELLFIGIKNGQTEANLIQFDTKSLFEEWISPQKYTATDMVVGNVDNDADPRDHNEYRRSPRQQI